MLHRTKCKAIHFERERFSDVTLTLRNRTRTTTQSPAGCKTTVGTPEPSGVTVSSWVSMSTFFYCLLSFQFFGGGGGSGVGPHQLAVLGLAPLHVLFQLLLQHQNLETQRHSQQPPTDQSANHQPTTNTHQPVNQPPMGRQ